MYIMTLNCTLDCGERDRLDHTDFTSGKAKRKRDEKNKKRRREERKRKKEERRLFFFFHTLPP